MIKLVTQFDNEKSKLSLATPTCAGCCCCCCCCIISTLTTASISARNFGNYVAKKLPNKPKKIKAARKIGFWLPIGLFGIFILAGGIAITFNSPVPLLSIAIYLVIMTASLMDKLNLPGIILKVILSSILLGVFALIEVYMVIYALDELDDFGYFYVAGVILSLLSIRWAFGKKYDNTNNKNSSNNKTNKVLNKR